MPSSSEPSGTLETSPNNIAQASSEVAGLLANQKELSSELAISDRAARQFGRTLTTAFLGLAVQGRNVGDVIRQLALSLSRLTLNAAFSPLQNALGGALQGLIGSGLTSAAQSLVSGTGLAAPAALPLTITPGQATNLASNTSSAAGQPQLVPPGMATSSAAPVIFNVTTPDSESFRRSETQIAAMLNRAVAQGQRNL
ncbi:MAG: phage tail tape measure protein [Hyphomicrobiaceae bacterium]